jgi:superfamily II DNA or RNA helicase
MPTAFELGPVWSRVHGDRARVDQLIKEWSAPLEEGMKLTDGHGNILSGLVQFLVPQVEGLLIDNRELPQARISLPSWLRDYQREAVLEGLERTRGVIKATTGAGKTVIGAGLFSAAQVRWVFMVHKPDVVRQAAASFRKFLNEPVIELKGKATDWNGRILCATYDQFLNSDEGMEWLATADGILVDECHRAPTTSAAACITAATNAFWRLGLSATPFVRSDNRDILTVGLIGEQIYEIKAEELIQENNITPLDIQWKTCHHGPTETSPRDWNEFYDERIVDNPIRNRILVETARYAPTPALLFVKRKRHAAALAYELQRLHPEKKIVSVDSDVPKDDRQVIIDDVNNQNVDIVVSTAVFNEGIDASEFRSAIIGAGGKSWIEGLQRPGRLTRLAENKPLAHVWDIADVGHPKLEEHTLERCAAYKSEGFKVAEPAMPTPEADFFGDDAFSDPGVNDCDTNPLAYFLPDARWIVKWSAVSLAVIGLWRLFT